MADATALCCRGRDFFSSQLEPEPITLNATPGGMELLACRVAQGPDIMDAIGVETQLHGAPYTMNITELKLVEDFW
jgi:hypothetical protein